MTWTPWKPAGYPIQDPFHNPWVPIDPISGNTAFQIWVADRTITEAEFRAKVNRLQGIK